MIVSILSGVARKTRIVDVVYNSSNNELVRTKTLVKNTIVLIDATPFRHWYENHYAMLVSKKKGQKLTEEEEKILAKLKTKSAEKKYKLRQKSAKLEGPVEEQLQSGRILGEFQLHAVLSSLFSMMNHYPCIRNYNHVELS